jgi:hypothetical protein
VLADAESEPLVVEYIRWLSVEVTGLLKLFDDVNENFICAMVEGTLVMAGDSIDLATLKNVAADSGADILPMRRDVRKVMRVVSKKWWHSFGYDYVLVAIHAKFCEVIAHARFVLL